jgi:hypothetical protein
MNDRCAVALKSPCSEAQETMEPKFWERMCVDGRWLSTIVTINK